MHNTKHKPLASLTHDKRTNSVREGVTARICTLTGWNHLLHTNTKRKRVSSFAFLRYTRILITNRILRVCVIKTYRLFDVESTARVDTCTS